jgi:DHA2 family multidrug resistance protein-like MFS transporter
LRRGRALSVAATMPLPGASLADGLPPRQRVAALLAISVAMCMATLDTAITNTALPTIAADIGASAAASIWVINAYQLAVVAFLLPLAALGDIVGHRRVYIAGLVLFTVTSLACGLAWSLPTLVGARALQGLGAAGIMSVNTALIRFAYPAKTLGRGLGINALVVALAFTIGPTVTSAILSVATWHWLFLINVPAGLLAAGLSLRTLPVTARAGHGYDVVAAVLCAGFFGCLIMMIGGVSHGTSWPIVAGEGAVALLCAVLLVRREVGHPAPMLALDLFRLPVFALSSATALCSFATQGLAFVSLPFLLQNVLGHDQVETGFLITPWPAVVAIMAPIAGRLSDRYPAGLLGGIGLFILCLGMTALALMPANPSVLDICWRMALCGAGFGFFQSPNLRALMASAPPGRSGGASGIVAVSRLMGQTLGAALVALCFNLVHGEASELALWVGAGFAGVGALASVLRLVKWRVADRSEGLRRSRS